MRRLGFRRVGRVVFMIALCAAPPSVAAAAADAPQPGGGGSGFRLVTTDQGTVTLRLLSYLRFLDQTSLDPTYTDSFGSTSDIDRRRDVHLNKMNIQFMGWVKDPKLHYLAYVWTAGTSQGLAAQVVVGGNLAYTFSPLFALGGGIGSLPGVRTTEGTFPYWLSMDNRLIADEFFRPSYTMGVWAEGDVGERAHYQFMLGNNLSQFGVDASQLDPGLNTVSMALKWFPTTGEYGPRSAQGDFEHHEELATRLAAHFTASQEDRQGQPDTEAFENVQIRLSDGNVIFEPDLFAPGVQVNDATYHMFALDAGAKRGGFALEGEYYWRWVDDLEGPGVNTLPFDSFNDDGFQILASAMAIPSTFQVYTSFSTVFGEYGEPWDLRAGFNAFPWKDREVWWNVEYLYTHRSPVGSNSLPYLVGGTGGAFRADFIVNF
jgi:hypothetical protein